MSFYQKSTLSNGLTVITEQVDSVRSVALGIWFRVGSRDEVDANRGISHFIEHMTFKGTPSRSALDISAAFDAMGANLNAFTSKESTCYYAHFTDENLTEAVDILSDMVLNSEYSDAEMLTERQVVLEEIARSEDQPDDYVFDLYFDAAYPQHSVGKPIIGYRNIVESFTHAHCDSYVKSLYNTSNCVVVASGNVQHDQLVQLLEQRLSTFRVGEQSVRQNVAPNLLKVGDKSNDNNSNNSNNSKPANYAFTGLKKETEQANLLMGFPCIDARSEQRFALKVLSSIVGGPMSSRLFTEVREKRGLVYAVYSTPASFYGGGQFVIYAGTRPENIGEVTSVTKGVLSEIVESGVTTAELERMKQCLIGHTVLNLESTSARMRKLGSDWVSDIESLSIDEVIERIKAVTLGEVQTLAQEMFTQAPLFACISPLETAAVESAIDKVL